jgi:hypothetical protein
MPFGMSERITRERHREIAMFNLQNTSDSTITVHPNGMLKSCMLKDQYEENSILYKKNC